MEKIFTKSFAAAKSKGMQKFDISQRRNVRHPLLPLQNIKFRISLTFAVAKVFANIFSNKILFRKLFRNNIGRGQI